MQLVEPDRRRRRGASATPRTPRAGAPGEPSMVQEPSPGRRWPPLVATSTSAASPPQVAQRLGDEALVVAHLVGVQVVGVGGVDQRHAGVQRRVDGGERAVAVRTALDRHGHAAQADRGDGPVADGSCPHALAIPAAGRNDARGTSSGTPGARARGRRAAAAWSSPRSRAAQRGQDADHERRVVQPAGEHGVADLVERRPSAPACRAPRRRGCAGRPAGTAERSRARKIRSASSSPPGELK